jgi:pyrimidine-nucleoside phosphorylase
MRITDIIEHKRDGGELTSEEIQYFVEGYTRGEIPDYQVAPTVVDKHSSGGVGDKVSLVVAPLVAASGLAVGKMSGRGLSFSGGTIDKLESIAGYRASLTEDEFRRQLKAHGIVVSGQSKDLAPADGKLYALRDVTGTVPSLPLIASSIMSKKIATGADAIVLDVKCGSGAFMKTPDEARRLAETMVGIGHELNRRVTALIGDMDQPLGQAIGNALEVKEAIDTLHGHGPADLTEHCLVVASHMLHLGGRAATVEAGRVLAEQLLDNGQAWAKFVEWIVAQGGEARLVEQPERLPRAAIVRDVLSDRAGHVKSVNALEVGLTSVDLGAGREKKDDPIDYAVGIVLHVKVADRVEANQPLFTIHANDKAKATSAGERLRRAIAFSDEPVKPLPLFYGLVE